MVGSDGPVQPAGGPRRRAPPRDRHGAARGGRREARAAGGRRLVLHAQTYAQQLYENAGYRTRGSVFTEAGIEHIAMEKEL